MPRGLVFSLAAASAFAALAGCARDASRSAPPLARPLGRDLPSFHAPEKPTLRAAPPALPDEPADLLTLRQALALALMRNPELAAFSWEMRAAEARVVQAGLRPNPEVGLSLEDFAGSGARSGFKVAELALELGQVIELGGKRARRIRAAERERDLSAWDYEAKRLDVCTQTARAYVELLAAQKRRELARETLRLAERARDVVGERVRAGKAAPVEGSKATVELAAGRVAAQRAERDADTARRELAAMWGSADPRFTRVDGDLTQLRPVPSFEALVRCVAENPDLARWAAEMALRRAAADIEESQAIPDLTVGAGIKHSEESNDRTGILGFSIPLPIFDRNQGGILEARYRLAKGEEERRAAEVRVKIELYRAWQTLAQAHSEAATLQDQALPAALRAFETAQEGYTEGKWGYLEVLDAQRTLFETQARWIDALSTCHQAAADAERLIGQSLDSVSASPVALN